LDYLTVFSKQGAQLNRDFMLAFPTLCFMALVETHKTKGAWLLPGVKVVQEGAAMQGMHNYVELQEDHISICKPKSPAASSYRLFTEYLQFALESFQKRKAAAAQVQQRVLSDSTLAQLELTREVAKLEHDYSELVQPAMTYLRTQKSALQPAMGDRWAEALYYPGRSEDDRKALSKHRKTVQNFWRQVQKMRESGLLGDDFFKGNWARRAKDCRLLWEPVDIANYYRLNYHNTSRHYIDDIQVELTDDNDSRPGRYILMQQQEQRSFAAKDPTYTTASSLGLARLLKDRVGGLSWSQYLEMLQEQDPDGYNTGIMHVDKQS
jgi:hypothetical protein